MDKKEKKEMVGVVGEALEQVVLPELQTIRDDVKELKNDINEVKETQGDHGDTLHGIETRMREETKTLDNHEGRITRLEKEAVL